MAAATVTLAGNFGAGFVTITDLLSLPIRIQRTFQSNEPDDLVMAPAIAQFSLDNSATNSGSTRGWYSLDSASKRSGFALGMPIRIQITANGNTRTVFIGYLDGWVPDVGIFSDQAVLITAVSWLGIAATTPISSLASQANKRGDQLVATAVALTGSLTPPATSYATGLDTYPFAFYDLDPKTGKVTDALDATARSGFDRIFEKADGTLVYETRQTRELGSTPVLTITDVGTVSYPSLAIIEKGMAVKRDRTSLPNTFKVVVRPVRTDASAVTLYSLPVSGTSPSIDAGQTLTFEAQYVDPSLLSQGIGAFNTLISDGGSGRVIGTSGSLPTPDYQFGTTAGGGGTNVSSSMTVTVVYHTSSATITVTNNTSATAYFGLLRCMGQGVYAYQAVTASAENTGSSATAGTTLKSIECPYQSSGYFADSAAKWCAANWSSDISQIENGIQLFVPASEDATIDLLLQREISDPIAISETITGFSAKPYWINGMVLEIDGNTNIRFTLPLARMLVGNAWTLGIAGASELGQTSVLAYF